MSKRPKDFPRSAWFHMSQRGRKNSLWFLNWGIHFITLSPPNHWLKLTYQEIDYE